MYPNPPKRANFTTRVDNGRFDVMDTPTEKKSVEIIYAPDKAPTSNDQLSHLSFKEKLVDFLM